MNKIQRLSLLAIPLFLILSAHAYAEIYRCRDSAGRLITADRIMPECADKTTQVYTNSGVLRRQLPGPITAEQRRAAELEEQQRIKQIQQQIQEQKEKRYLTTHYPTEQAIEVARQKELDVVEEKIGEEKKTIEVTTEALTKNRQGQARLSKKQTEELSRAQNEEEQLVQTIQQSERMIQRYQVEKTKVNHQFDETRKRYLEIVGPDNKQ